MMMRMMMMMMIMVLNVYLLIVTSKVMLKDGNYDLGNLRYVL